MSSSEDENRLTTFYFGKDILKKRYREDLTWEETESLLKRFFVAWGYNQEMSPEKYLNIAREECGINIQDIANQSMIFENFRFKMREVQMLEYFAKKHEKLDELYDGANDYGSILKNMLIVVGNGMHALLSLRSAMMGLRPNFDSVMTDDQRLLSVKVRNVHEYEKFEMLIRYTLEYINKLGYRRYHEDIYEKVVNKDGQSTNAWKRVMEIRELVHHLVDKDENEEIWRILYSAGNYTKLVSYLTECQEYEFPDLEKDRTVFSFKNGVYLARENKFVPYEVEKLSEDVIACKYFEQEFQDLTETPWKEIPTPSFECIIEFQLSEEKEYKEILNVAYILIGRMLYDLRTMEDWQVIPFFKGFAQTGKSTILKEVIKAFYESADVGILSNSCAENFPVENLYDKYVYIAPDIDTNFRLNQMFFQSMVSGEDVSVTRKHKIPLDMVWKSPGALAGNELFGYKDNGNSIGRRTILFEFMKALTPDQLKRDLSSELKTELPLILLKCNKAYLHAVKEWGRQDIWSKLPKYFHKNRDYLLEQTNTLLQFLKSDRIVLKENAFLTKEQFVLGYQSFCKEHGLAANKFNKDLYSAPFAICEAKHRLKIAVRVNPLINGFRHKGQYIEGVQFNTPDDDVYDSDEERESDLKKGPEPHQNAVASTERLL